MNLPAEATVFHNRIQKLTLAVEESRIFWCQSRPDLSAAAENRLAFAERWFGGKTSLRVGVILADLRARYRKFPAAMAVLRRLQSSDADTRRMICHWHLQLSDPLYRRFTGQWMAERRELGAAMDLHAVRRWVLEVNPKGWSPATCNQVARKLLAAATEAGLVDKEGGLPLPTVPDLAVGYLLHLLREVTIAGSTLDNVYLHSVGLTGMALARRLGAKDWVKVSSMGGISSIDWRFRNLAEWAEVCL